MTDTTAKADEVLYEVERHVATITLNAPERMNTLSQELMGLLAGYLVEADSNPDVRAVVLRISSRVCCWRAVSFGVSIVAVSCTRGAGPSLAGYCVDIQYLYF